MNRDAVSESDAAILERVRYALRTVDGLTVAGVEAGVVTISGIVASEALAVSVVEIARSTEGVTEVRSDDLMWDREPDLPESVPPVT